MKRYYYWWILFLALSWAQSGMAQEIRPDTAIRVNSSFTVVGVKFLNDWVYMGRKDSIATPYLIPRISYYHQSGLFISTSLYYLMQEGSNRVDLTAIRAGYNNLGNKLSWGLAITNYIFHEESFNVQSPMNVYVNGYLGYDFDLIETEIYTGLGFSENTDAFLIGEINKSFYLFKGDLKLIPSFSLNFGTQYYYNEYQNVRGSMSGGQGMGHGGGSSSSTVFMDDVSKFQLLSYEISLFTRYYLGRFSFTFEPTYAIPQNPSTLTLDQTTITENLENTFFWSAGVNYWF